ncbi:MAG: hypothetical protein Q9220_000390 [cf. Caloplaca sp. 1 TL-2023]
MRFLCLHGKGTSAAIFKSQTTSFRAKLPPNAFSFTFLDGFLPSPPAPGIDLFYPPPYYSFWNSLSSIPEIRAAHEWLDERIEELGPFDGVMGFSQGCSLIASYVLYRQQTHPGRELPFKCAVFICGGVPLQVLEDLGVEVTEAAWEMNKSSAVQLMEQASGDAILKRGAQRWRNVNYKSNEGFTGETPVDDASDVFGLDFTRGVLGGLRIKIPTVHVYGSKDPRCPASLQLAELCEKRWRRVFDHGGGHDVPRKTEVSEGIAQLVEWTQVVAGVN